MTTSHDQIPGQIPGDEPDAIRALLPWYANGTLGAQDRRRVEEALARDTTLVAELAAIREEAAETIHLNETLGAPSSQAMHSVSIAAVGAAMGARGPAPTPRRESSRQEEG